jgi:outer membrane lipoprotein-sorting protein
MPLLCCLLFLLHSCAPVARRGWVPNLDPALLLDHARRELESLADLKAAADLTLIRPGQKQHASAALLFRPPDLFRVEVRGPLFVHLFTALLRGDSLAVGDGEGHWRGGPATPEALSRLLGLDLAGYDLRCALLGLVAPGPLDSLALAGPGRALAYLAGAPGRRLWLDTRRGFVVVEELLGARGEILLTRRLAEYQRVGGRYLPRRVEIRQGEHALLLEYRSWELDTGLGESAFTRGIPLDRLEPLE